MATARSLHAACAAEATLSATSRSLSRRDRSSAASSSRPSVTSASSTRSASSSASRASTRRASLLSVARVCWRPSRLRCGGRSSTSSAMSSSSARFRGSGSTDARRASSRASPSNSTTDGASSTTRWRYRLWAQSGLPSSVAAPRSDRRRRRRSAEAPRTSLSVLARASSVSKFGAQSARPRSEASWLYTTVKLRRRSSGRAFLGGSKSRRRFEETSKVSSCSSSPSAGYSAASKAPPSSLELSTRTRSASQREPYVGNPRSDERPQPKRVSRPSGARSRSPSARATADPSRWRRPRP
mmetsp:Transcript_9995/g.34576  ORF Transcript_9995/g.34576 Transcript_9995/m.34576 type:complete len:298 (+) Transcript_9995:360-1253(+)